MAIRYSGDVEIRLHYSRGRYTAQLRAPGFRANGSLSLLELRRKGLLTRKQPNDPESYDLAAKLLIHEAKVAAKKRGFTLHTSNEVRRTFQSPCPYRT